MRQIIRVTTVNDGKTINFNIAITVAVVAEIVFIINVSD